LKKYFEILRKCPLFIDIGDNDLEAMLCCFGATVQFFDKKNTIIFEGCAAKYIGVVLSGEVQVWKYDYYGNRSILNMFREGEVFAEEFACAAVPSIPVTIVASEPSHIMLLNIACVMNACQNYCAFHQRLMFNLMHELAQKTIAHHQRIEIVSKRSTREKLLAYLLLEKEKRGSNDFEIVFNRQELADYLEVERSGLSVEIGKLIQDGIILNKRKHFVLL